MTAAERAAEAIAQESCENVTGIVLKRKMSAIIAREYAELEDVSYSILAILSDQTLSSAYRLAKLADLHAKLRSALAKVRGEK